MANKRIFTDEQKEKLAYIICSEDPESRDMAWQIIETVYNEIKSTSEKNKFKNKLNHAKRWLNYKEYLDYGYKYWRLPEISPENFEKFKKNIMLLDIYEKIED